MKLTANMLRQIIKEETQRVLVGEVRGGDSKSDDLIQAYAEALVDERLGRLRFAMGAPYWKEPSDEERVELISRLVADIEDFAYEKVEEITEEISASGGVSGFEEDEDDDDDFEYEDDDLDDEFDDEDDEVDEGIGQAIGRVAKAGLKGAGAGALKGAASGLKQGIKQGITDVSSTKKP